MPWEKEYGYAQSVKVGDTIYLSGQVSHDDRGNIVGLGDMEAQMRQAYANIQKVLAQYGAAMENIVDEILFVSFPAPLLLQAPSYKFSVLPFLSS
jgi:enamine deaminase RidA (YjgF/YER057c/UK114 family)